jgi:hypothetical protein
LWSLVQFDVKHCLAFFKFSFFFAVYQIGWHHTVSTFDLIFCFLLFILVITDWVLNLIVNFKDWNHVSFNEVFWILLQLLLHILLILSLVMISNSIFQFYSFDDWLHFFELFHFERCFFKNKMKFEKITYEIFDVRWFIEFPTWLTWYPIQ